MKVAPVKRIENGMERRFGMAFLGRDIPVKVLYTDGQVERKREREKGGGTDQGWPQQKGKLQATIQRYFTRTSDYIVGLVSGL